MAKPQIQYSPIAEPPAFTPPTTDAQGWRPCYPIGLEIRRAQLTGAIYAGSYISDTKTPAAAVVPVGYGAKVPDDPRLGRRTQLSGAIQAGSYVTDTKTPAAPIVPVGCAAEIPDDPRLGRRTALPIAQYPWLAYDASPENWTISRGADAEAPDSPYQFRLTRWRLPLYQPETEFGVEVDVPVESWSALGPDTTAARPRLQAANIPAFTGDTLRAVSAATPTAVGTVGPDDPRMGRKAVRLTDAPFTYDAGPEFLTIPQGAGCELPDDPRLGRKARLVEFSPIATTPTLDQFAPTAWWPSVPDRVPRRATRAPEYPAFAATFALEQFSVPPLAWLGVQPDRLVRPRTLPEQLAFVNTFVQFVTPAPALAVTVFPDRLDRARRLTEYPALSMTSALEQLAVPALCWQPPCAPARVWKAARLAEYPATSLIPGLEAFAVPPLSWTGTQPDRLVRAKGLPVYQATWDTLTPEPWPVTMTWQPAASDRVLRVKSMPDAGTVQPVSTTSPVTPILTETTLPVRGPRRPFTVTVQNVLPQGNPVAPTLSWQGSAPDRVWRLTLPTAAQSFAMFLPSLAVARRLPGLFSSTTLRAAAVTSTTVRSGVYSSTTPRGVLYSWE